MKGAALDKFLLRKQGLHRDGVPIPNVAVADLDAKTLAWFRAQAANSQRLLESRLAARIVLMLIKGESGKVALAAKLGHATVSGNCTSRSNA